MMGPPSKWPLVKPLLRLYDQKGKLLSYGQIAARIGMTRAGVYRLAKIHGATEARKKREDACDTQR